MFKVTSFHFVTLPKSFRHACLWSNKAALYHPCTAFLLLKENVKWLCATVNQ